LNKSKQFHWYASSGLKFVQVVEREHSGQIVIDSFVVMII
jgi:hypothetical protein